MANIPSIVVVECVYHDKHGATSREIALVAATQRPGFGVAVMELEAEKEAVKQLRSQAAGPSIKTRVRISVPLSLFSPGGASPMFAIQPYPPHMNLGTHYREHNIEGES